MIVGFIGFGEVSSVLSNILSKNGIRTVTVVKGRSNKTQELAVKSDVQILDSYETLIKGSDIVISANSPANALKVAEKYADLMEDNIYIDLNNISPDTTIKIADLFEKDHPVIEEESKHSIFSNTDEPDLRNPFVDGAIIGKVSSEPSLILFSGSKAEDLAILNNYGLNVIIVSKIPGDVSTLKTLRSLYTKGVSAVLMETFEVAKSLDLESQLFEILSMTEGEDFELKARSRINNSYKNYRRKAEEMDEILNFLINVFPNKNFIMTKASSQKFHLVKK
ncbi:hypothetical protein BGI41_04745 [Methanobrevibacter sp. 87.7]|uniref:NAD(P)-binding domain-containing protein n=1 Tax=Methanobrevibacter sp. 87.7 TaxID=387957 RepID=UPI000B6F7075|nr:NAD(P)-binding domain-containing protein [Methanobrevibacter sp. 87.7]OWT32983.1 hypothetical protein BGI41_04745 [Methanobrevibacter sp. 87.7]